MNKDKKIVSLFVLSILGFWFSGYLSGIKFFSETCAFGESCPYFLGYPACYFGFIMFTLLLMLSFGLTYNKINIRVGIKGILTVSFLGVLFAGYYTLKEIPILFEKGVSAYILGLPTCALGLIFYVLVFLITLFTEKSINYKRV
jgi:hypothetical protein